MVCQKSFGIWQLTFLFLECIIFVSWILHFPQIYIQFEVIPMKYRIGVLLSLLLPEGTVNSELSKY